jgi:hypothetical protein
MGPDHEDYRAGLRVSGEACQRQALKLSAIGFEPENTWDGGADCVPALWRRGQARATVLTDGNVEHGWARTSG